MIWFYIGDLIEWLGTRPTVSGVQRVTLETLFAANALAARNRAPRVGVCCLDETGTTLRALPTDAALSYLASWHAGSSDPSPSSGMRGWLARLTARPAAPPGPPEPGNAVTFGLDDHILFLGLVWTPMFCRLFTSLAAEGRAFSVLVHDLIHIERPDLVGETGREMFAAWMRVVAVTARTILVSSESTRDAILAWASAEGADLRARIVAVTFGMSHLGAGRAGEAVAGAAPGGFVLSVGTIDRRKNQALLMDVWAESVANGFPEIPPLVLAGRLDLADMPPAATRLIDDGKIRVLDGLSDRQLAWLYQNCLFTAFSSTAEGYGIPVAESLAFGKLCISADLPQVRDFAGDFAWYFASGSVGEARRQIEHACRDAGARQAAEARIRSEFNLPDWTGTVQDILRGIGTG